MAFRGESLRLLRSGLCYFFLDADFLRGTLAPARRASDSPMAMACLRLFTFLPDRPLFRVPFLRSRIARSTFSDAFLPYLAICCLLLRVPGRFQCNASCVPR